MRRILIILFFIVCSHLINAQDTLFFRGFAPIAAKVSEIEMEEDGYVYYQSQSAGNTKTEKKKKAEIKCIKFENNYIEKCSSNPAYYTDELELINKQLIRCSVIKINVLEYLLVETEISAGRIRIPFDSVLSLTSASGKKDIFTEQNSVAEKPLEDDAGESSGGDEVDMDQVKTFLNKLSESTIQQELEKAKRNIEEAKVLFDVVVRSGKYTGEISNDMLTEIIFTYCDHFQKSYFKGKLRNGLPNGNGEYYKPKGEIQIGEFAKGRLNGKGKIIRNGITIKEGSFRNGELYGEGIITDERGKIQKGKFFKNQLTGEGSIQFSGGATEKGEYRESRLNGEGERRFSDDNYYAGNFSEGKFNGKGVYYWSRENVSYVGDFEGGKRSGPGMLKINDNITVSGIWKNDCPEGEIEIISGAGTDNESIAVWVVKDCSVESKNIKKGKIRLADKLLFIKMSGL